MKVYLLNGVENIVIKEEIAHQEQFHLLSQCFEMSTAVVASKDVYVGKVLRPPS